MNTESLRAGAGTPARSGFQTNGKGKAILYTIALVLIILWLLGLATGYTMGGVLHVFLLLALVMVLLNFLSGRRNSI